MRKFRYKNLTLVLRNCIFFWWGISWSTWKQLQSGSGEKTLLCFSVLLLCLRILLRCLHVTFPHLVPHFPPSKFQVWRSVYFYRRSPAFSFNSQLMWQLHTRFYKQTCKFYATTVLPITKLGGEVVCLGRTLGIFKPFFLLELIEQVLVLFKLGRNSWKYIDSTWRQQLTLNQRWALISLQTRWHVNWTSCEPWKKRRSYQTHI